jgi:hypothetical protein
MMTLGDKRRKELVSLWSYERGGFTTKGLQNTSGVAEYTLKTTDFSTSDEL